MAVPTHMGGQEDDPDDISKKVMKLLRYAARLQVAVHAASSNYVQGHGCHRAQCVMELGQRCLQAEEARRGAGAAEGCPD